MPALTRAIVLECRALSQQFAGHDEDVVAAGGLVMTAATKLIMMHRSVSYLGQTGRNARWPRRGHPVPPLAPRRTRLVLAPAVAQVRTQQISQYNAAGALVLENAAAVAHTPVIVTGNGTDRRTDRHTHTRRWFTLTAVGARPAQ